MNITLVVMLVAVGIAGAVGGVINALMSDNGFLLPRKEQTSNGNVILRPGCAGNAVIGAIAAIISWGLYGPLATQILVGTEEALKGNAGIDKIGLSLASFVGAVLVGIGGARWLSNEVDKTLLRATAAEAAAKQPSPALAQRILIATPKQALDAAKQEGST
jgi:hypothetical protein